MHEIPSLTPEAERPASPWTMEDLEGVAVLAERVNTMRSLFTDADYETVASEVIEAHPEADSASIIPLFKEATDEVLKEFPEPDDVTSGISPDVYRDFAEHLISVHERHQKAA